MSVCKVVLRGTESGGNGCIFCQILFLKRPIGVFNQISLLASALFTFLFFSFIHSYLLSISEAVIRLLTRPNINMFFRCFFLILTFLTVLSRRRGKELRVKVPKIESELPYIFRPLVCF